MIVAKSKPQTQNKPRRGDMIVKCKFGLKPLMSRGYSYPRLKSRGN